MAPAEAALFGTKEVATPVTFGVITTMVAFAPLLLVEGQLSNIAKQIPLVVIPVLAFSLVESKLILPAHMSSVKPRDESSIKGLARLQQNFSRGFENAILKIYRPFLERCVANKTITLVTAFCIFDDQETRYTNRRCGESISCQRTIYKPDKRRIVFSIYCLSIRAFVWANWPQLWQ